MYPTRNARCPSKFSCRRIVKAVGNWQLALQSRWVEWTFTVKFDQLGVTSCPKRRPSDKWIGSQPIFYYLDGSQWDWNSMNVHCGQQCMMAIEASWVWTYWSRARDAHWHSPSLSRSLRPSPVHALWRRRLTGWQPVHQCCFPSLPAVEFGFIWCELLSNCKHTAIVIMCNKEYYYYCLLLLLLQLRKPPIFPTFTDIFSIFSLSSVDNFNFLLDAILQSARQTRTKWRHVNKREL